MRLTYRIVLALAAIFSLPTYGQRQQAAPTPNDTLKSVEVLDDHRVTFRIYAPKASEVAVSGDWITQGRGKGGPLEKDASGVWSITVGPLVPDFYSFRFNVDGVRTLDPKSAFIKPGLNTNDSMFEVPGAEAAYEALRPVPHGEVRTVWYQSSTLDMMRSMRVYTPPDYDNGKGKFPVFYLLHGGGDDDSGWSTIGRAGFILDNLLAEMKVKPMIVVMPNGSMPGPGPSAPVVFQDEFLKNVVPYVEKHYRVNANRENRAIAGLSMGGGQTLRIAPANLDLFGYVGVWSMGIAPDQTADFEKRNAAFFAKPEKTNKELKLLWVAVGENDTLVGANARNLHQFLTDKRIRHDFQLSEGGHTWINWRHYLNEFAPLLFRP